MDQSRTASEPKRRLRLRNRFAELLAAHQRTTRRNWKYEEISKVTGVSPGTLSSYAQNKVTRYDEVTVVPLMEFFGLTDVGKLLVLEEEEVEDEGQQKAVAAG